MRQKYMPGNFKIRSKGMLITKNILKFNKLLINIPRQTKRVWDLSENRWGYKTIKKL